VTGGAGGASGAGGVGAGAGNAGTVVAGGGATGGGGGGAAFGGAVFVRQGATLKIADGSFSGSSVTAGTGANNGAAAGSSLFLMSGTTTTFNPTGTLTVGDTIADDSAASLPGGTYTAGSGAGAAIAITGGTVVLTGANSFSGGTTLTAGTLTVGNSSALGSGALAMAQGTTLGFDSNGNYTLGNNITISGDPIFDVPSGTQTISGNITDATLPAPAGIVEKNGAGTLVLSGTNTYSGGTTINAGTLQATNNSSVGTGTVTFNAGTFQAGAAGLSFDNSFFVDAGKTGTIDTQAFTTTLTGAGGNSLTGSGTINKTGSGTLIVDKVGLNNGTVNVQAGTVQAAANDAFGQAANYNIASGATLDVNGHSQTIQTLTGDGTVTNADSIGATLTVGTNNNVSTVPFLFAGTIKDGTDPLGLKVDGTRPMILTGTNTYSLGTLVCDCSTLQLGNGGTTGSIVGLITSGGTLIFNRSDTYDTFATNNFIVDSLSGHGKVVQAGTGTTIFGDGMSYSGTTTISAGKLQIGHGTSEGSIGSGDIIDNATLAINKSNGFTLPNNISGTGALEQNGIGVTLLSGHNTYSGGTFVNTGALVAGVPNTFSPNSTFTVASGATLDGSSFDQTIGALTGAGHVTIDGTLTTGNNNSSTTFSGVIQGFGGLTKVGTGNFNLTGINTYFGPTTINGGILSVNGSILKSSGVTVNAGGALGGNGQLPSVTINGGALAPGNSIGTITINGNLVLSSAATYMVEVSPSEADRTNVTGKASLAGTVAASFAPGSYVARSYTILSAAGGLNGTFAALTTAGLPAGFAASLTYTGTDVDLDLTAVLGHAASPSLAGSALNSNQTAVATALNNFFNAGGALPTDFLSVFGLTGQNLGNALTQLSGETATAVAPAGLEAQNRFLMLMLDPFAGVGEASGATTLRATSFGEEETAQPDNALAYAPLPTKAPPTPAASFAQRWSAWAATYGSESRARGDAAIGSHDRDVRTGNIASGLDYRFSPDTTVGFAFSGGSASFGLSDGLGSGHGDIYQFGGYAATRWQGFYLAASAALSRYEVTESRNVAIAGTLSALSGDTAAHALGARFEAGRRYGDAGGGVTPFAALQTQSIRTPAFGEAANAGATAVALNYAEQTTTRTRSELGIGADRRFDLAGGSVIGFGRAAWGHEFNRDALITPGFAALSGSAFTVQGAQAAANSALLSAGLLWSTPIGWSLRLKGDGEFASSVTTYAGTATLRYVW
jgi:autotransporter-associated beta strand protein